MISITTRERIEAQARADKMYIIDLEDQDLATIEGVEYTADAIVLLGDYVAATPDRRTYWGWDQGEHERFDDVRVFVQVLNMTADGERTGPEGVWVELPEGHGFEQLWTSLAEAAEDEGIDRAREARFDDHEGRLWV